VELDPDLRRVIEAMPGWDPSAAHAEILGGGITNRNFRVDLPSGSVVVRLAGADTELLGVDREAERAATEAAARAGVGPEVVAYLPEHRALITRFVPGEPLPPEDLERPEVMSAVILAVKAIHSMPAIPSAFDVFRVVRDYHDVAAERGVEIPTAYADALEVADRIQESFASSPTPARPCHDDLLNANFLVFEGKVVIVDYEYAGMGDPFFDLGNLAVNNGISEAAQGFMLERYFGAPTAAQYARLALMRIMSDFREAMWGIVQQGISTLEFDYVDYADRHFERCLANAGDERFGSWLAEAAMGP
jgi:aminoglycoside phosphotransferase (APT) family kinase protein